MMIPNDERSPRYFGAVTRACKGKLGQCPYVKNDPRMAQWYRGYNDGIIEPSEPKEKK